MWPEPEITSSWSHSAPLATHTHMLPGEFPSATALTTMYSQITLTDIPGSKPSEFHEGLSLIETLGLHWTPHTVKQTCPPQPSPAQQMALFPSCTSQKSRELGFIKSSYLSSGSVEIRQLQAIPRVNCRNQRSIRGNRPSWATVSDL